MEILPDQSLQLVSARLFLRPLLENDVDLVLELFTDPEMMEYAGGPVKSERIRTEMAVSVQRGADAVSYTHLRAHETPEHLVCRLLV